MQLITSAQRQKLLENGRAQRAALDQKNGAMVFEPVVKIFSPAGNATWFLTELDPNGHLAFGLCDLGLGEPELGYLSIHELAAARGSLGLPLERDLYFAPTRTISAYAELTASIGESLLDGSSGASSRGARFSYRRCSVARRRSLRGHVERRIMIRHAVPHAT
jgi:hypothetical protein